MNISLFSSIAVRMAGGALAVTTLSGCGGEVTVPVPDIQDDVREAIDSVREGIDFNLNIEEQVEQLQVQFCEAQGTPLAESIKGVVETIHGEIVEDNPGVAVPPLDLDPDKCA